MHYYCNHSIVKKKKESNPFAGETKNITTTFFLLFYYSIYITILLLYPSFEPFYIQLLLLCVKLYTRILQSWKKNAALIHQTYLCLIFCRLIYFSNFSRPGSSPSNSSSRNRIGKCKLIFDNGVHFYGKENWFQNITKWACIRQDEPADYPRFQQFIRIVQILLGLVIWIIALSGDSKVGSWYLHSTSF